ncbi:MAG: ABC transporter substrate-binding protein [Rhodospirillaceae bacterium]|nr:ABC transporter substrate-binding protein [Rhodospirillaceae bacterium]
MKIAIALAGAAACAGLLAAPAAQAQQELRIGYLVTTTGGAAIIGKHMIQGWKLGLEHEGWKQDGDKIAGVPLRMFYGDDQFKPDAALTVVDKFIKVDHVHMVAGMQWSNVMLAVRRPLLDNKILMMSNVAGASQFAGKECTPYFISTSWNNDQTAAATGTLLNADKIKSVWAMAPNYQAGKDVVTGMRMTYKGKVVGQTLFKPGETDYQADISRIRAEKPQAVFYFGPGAMGISFLKQWSAAGIGKEIKLYTQFTVDWISLPVVGESALGTFHTNQWDIDSKNPTNQKFVKDYVAHYGAMPPHYAQQAYDGPRLIAAALRATKGKFSDPIAFMKAMRHTTYPSVRGPYKYNVNGIPIQDFYKREVVKNPDGKLWIKTVGIAVKSSTDPYWQQCPAANRL